MGFPELAACSIYNKCSLIIGINYSETNSHCITHVNPTGLVSLVLEENRNKKLNLKSNNF